MPTLSIALCTYNGSRYLDAQLESYLAQTRLPDELVVRDDASTDASVSILRAFAGRAPFPVRIIEGRATVGYVKNFEAAIAACTGDLIALSDQDDVWLPGKLERLAAALDAAPAVLLAFSDARLVDGALRPIGGTMWEAVGLGAEQQRRIRAGGAASPLLGGAFVTGATVCFRRSLAALALPVGLPHWHDAWLALVAELHGGVLLVVEPLVLYRQHGGNELGAPRGGLVGRIGRTLGRGAQSQTAELEHGLESMAMQALQRFGDSLPPAVNRVLCDAARYHRLRASLPHYPSRFSAIAGEVLSGRYAAFGNGLRTAVGDLLRRPT